MAQYWFARADADEASDAQRQGDDRIKSFHHV
jgi:hypothetical protein